MPLWSMRNPRFSWRLHLRRWTENCKFRHCQEHRLSRSGRRSAIRFDTQSLGASASITARSAFSASALALMSQFRKKIEPQDLSATRRRLHHVHECFTSISTLTLPPATVGFPRQKSSFIVGFLPTLVSRRIILIKEQSTIRSS